MEENPRRKKYLRLAEIVAGFVLGGVIVSHYFNGQGNFVDFGLGDRTVSYQATDGTDLVHVIRNTDAEENQLLAGWERRGRRPVCFILGYSQAHAINEKLEGETNYPQILFDRHKGDSPPVDVLCQSLPNGSMCEYYALYAYWSKKLPIKALVVPACLDKMRNDNLRPEYLENLGFQNFRFPDPASPIADSLNHELAAFPKRGASADNAAEEDNGGLRNTTQDKVERSLDGWLQAHLPVWSHRADARGEIFTWLYLFRNSVLGISSNTKRPVIPAHYLRNMAALTGLLEDARKDNVRVLVYIPPVRSDIPILYDGQEYARYKADIRQLVDQYPGTARFLNIEGIVPGPLWGDLPPTNLSGRRQPDFMHFKYGGHQLTADAIDPAIVEMMRP